MVDKDKLAELEKAIKEKQAELSTVQKEIQGAANNPERLVLAQKRERRITEQLQALEKAKNIAEYKPAAPTDRDELLKSVLMYIDVKNENVDKAERSIKTAAGELQLVLDGLQQAAAECNIEKTVELSEKKAELESRLKYLQEMKKRVEALPVFPRGVITEEWEKICNNAFPDWQKAVMRVELLASEYAEACNALLAMHDTLKNARDEIKRIAERHNVSVSFSPKFTVGLDAEKLTVKKELIQRVSWIGSNLIQLPL